MRDLNRSPKRAIVRGLLFAALASGMLSWGLEGHLSSEEPAENVPEGEPEKVPASDSGVEGGSEPEAGGEAEPKESPKDEAKDEAKADPPREYGKDCLRSGCHEALKAQPSVHGPVAVGSCEVCHVAEEGEDHAFELAREEEELCVFCHAMPKEKKVVHKPFGQKGCLYCHDPHGGSTSTLLVKEEAPGGLCLQCHEKKESAHAHKPYLDGDCSKCHISHQSDHAGLMPSGGRDLCLRCHEPLAKALHGAKALHKPVETGECSGCHKGHESSFPALLVAGYTRDLYSAFDPAAYDLCFKCHPAKSFTDPKDTTTAFRDGTRNLHFLHVNKETKGRTCSVCHPSHDSASTRLVKADTVFGGWKLPIGFAATADGGSCASGCHREIAYSRERPVSSGGERGPRKAADKTPDAKADTRPEK